MKLSWKLSDSCELVDFLLSLRALHSLMNCALSYLYIWRATDITVASQYQARQQPGSVISAKHHHRDLHACVFLFVFVRWRHCFRKQTHLRFPFAPKPSYRHWPLISAV
eukprot:2192937-Pyramimonas_sp.AAC.1